MKVCKMIVIFLVCKILVAAAIAQSNDENLCDQNPCQHEGICYDQYNDYYDLNYVCSCTGNFSGPNCEILITEPSTATTEVSNSSFTSSYVTMFSTESYNLTKSTSDENISSSSMNFNSGGTSVTDENGLTKILAKSSEPTEETQTNTTISFRELTEGSKNSTEPTEETQTNTTISFRELTEGPTNFTEPTEEHQTNVTTSFRELNLTTTSTTQRISSQTIQSTHFSASSKQNTLPSSTQSKDGMISFGTSSTDDTITSSPTTDEVDSTPNYNFLNATRSTQDTRRDKNNRLPVAACVGISVLSIILILILTGGVIYSKKFRERKRMLLYANGEDTSSISNRSNCSFA